MFVLLAYQSEHDVEVFGIFDTEDEAKDYAFDHLEEVVREWYVVPFTSK